jgi:hypothetical protein
MSKPYGGLGMWVWEAGQNEPATLVQSLTAHGYSWLAVKAHDGSHGFNDPAQVVAYRAACRAHGLKFGIWGYLSAPGTADAAAASQYCMRFQPDFYIADAEVEYETATGPVSREFCTRFRQDHPRLPAALSSFGRPDLHAGIDWTAWRDHGFDWMPQAYECETEALAPRVCVQQALAIWPRERIFVTLGTYAGARGALTGAQLYASVADIALPGVNLWDAQELRNGQLGALGRLVRPTTPPAAKPASHLDGPAITRNLILTSPLMHGADVQSLQEALNGQLAAQHAQAVDVDGWYGPVSHHAVRVVGYALGLLELEATQEVQRWIRRPADRTPTQIRRAHARAQDAAHAQRKAGGRRGLGAVPAIAASHIGVAENPPGSNWGYPYPAIWQEHFGISHAPWCGAFAGSCVLGAGGHVSSRVRYCPWIEADAKSGTNGFDRWEADHQNGVEPGWLVLYCWDGTGVPEHVGIVESLESEVLVAIEGNTSGTNPSDGGMVARMQRPYRFTVGYARPRF